MITNYLKELLNDNECVIIPEFGAFISKRHSATIDYVNHSFLPPYKEIVFNNKLTNNDEILVDFISKKENISKEDSLTKIQNFVNQTAAILDVNNEYVMEGLGKMRKFGNDYVFEVSHSENLLGDSFGLTEFNYKPVFRTETYQIIKEKIVVEQKEKNTDYTIAIESVEETAPVTRRKPSMFRTLAYTTLAFLLVFALNWTTDKSDSNLASWNPFLYSSPNEFLIGIQEFRNSSIDNGQQTTDNSLCSQLGDFSLETVEEVALEEEIGVEEVETVEPTMEVAVTEEVIEVSGEDVIAEIVPEVVSEIQAEDISATQNLSNSEPQQLTPYYIIGGSFQTEASAEKCLNGIKNQGFENASTLDKNEKGYIRVYYESFAEKADALVRLDEIKSKYDKSAWLLFQK
ncbi:MAG: SPOR domain-containing protein [Bacteroidales bacterium]|nr:SPOR domain-containing protein [Bacteroidales bacterium]